MDPVTRKRRLAYFKARYERKRDSILIQMRRRGVEKRDKILYQHKIYYQKNKPVFKVYRQKNRDRTLAWRRKDHAEKCRIDPSYRVVHNMRGRLWKALCGRQKSATTMALVGCTKEQLVVHLEVQFKDGMTWQNYGPYWHVDHRKGCAEFDLSDPAQQRACFHYTNLRPRLAKENVIAGGFLGNSIASRLRTKQLRAKLDRLDLLNDGELETGQAELALEAKA